MFYTFYNTKSHSFEYKIEDNELILAMELPGVDGKSIRVTQKNGTLTVKGKKSTRLVKPTEFKDEYDLSSCADRFDIENPSATFENGVLTLIYNKRAEADGTEIDVHLVN